MEKAGFFPRLIAYFIDAIILGVISFVLSFVGALVDNSGTIGSLLTVVVALGYLIYFWGTSGQTPGKKVMGLRIVSADSAPMSYGKAVMRLIGYFVSSLVFELGFLWILFDKEKQGWHDKIAKTFVVKA